MSTKFRSFFIPILLFLLFIPSFSKLLRPGFFPMHDDMQVMRLLQMDKCIKDGQIPCQWVPDMGYGYGYPQFIFYSPLPYYAMEGFHLAGFGFLDSVKAVFVASVVISGFGMYLLGKSLWGKRGGFISSLFYIYIPYRAVDMYVRGAVGEFWAMGFLPIILWSAREVILGHKRAIIWLALALAALFTSHNITALIFMPVLVGWVVFLLFSRKDSPALKTKKLKHLFFAGLWGLAISSFFLLPAWFEKGFVHIETLLQGYFNYLAHFVSVGQLLFSNFFGFGTSELGPYDEISFSAGILHWILPLLLLVLLKYFKKEKEFLIVLFFTAIGWISLFLIHLRSEFIWNSIDILAFLQFPWRFLTIAALAFSISVGSIAVLLPKGRSGAFFIGILISILLIINVSFFTPKEWIKITDEERFSGELWEKQQTISIFDYLPIYAEYPPAERAPEEPLVIDGSVEFVSGAKGTNWQKWNVDVLTDSAKVRLALFDFPGWRVWIDGEKTSIDHENELGLITISVPAGEHEISARLTNTAVRTIGNLLSVAGLVAIPVFVKKKI